LRPEREGRTGAVVVARHHEADVRARVHGALQRVPQRVPQPGLEARLQHRSGHEGPRRGLPRDHAVGDGLRVLRHVVPGEGGAAGRPGLLGFRIVVAGGVPHPRGAVRELVAAVQRAPGHADRCLRRLRRALAAGPRQRRVRADRPGHADRPRRQERHPDRRVCQGRVREGRVARRGLPERRPAAAAAHPDDRVRLHSRRVAAGDREGRRRRLPPHPRHGRDGRDARRHLHRDLHHPGVVLRRRAVGPRRREAGEGAARRRARDTRDRERARWLLRCDRMRLLLPVLVSLALVTACGSRATERPAPEQSLRRTTTSGEVVGSVGRYGSATWLGIPYAAPPVGALRWRAPEPPPRWDGVREALVAGSPCVQYAGPFGGINDVKRLEPAGYEDCLFLNVYAPRAATPTSRLPVMVWIHGGGNSVGHAGTYDGGNLTERENVVVVTINYRLGPFGWLRHAALRGDGTTDLDRSGNFGTLDQIRALEWVRDNVAVFGGDPGNVTVFGESAGGRNVVALLDARPARRI